MPATPKNPISHNKKSVEEIFAKIKQDHAESLTPPNGWATFHADFSPMNEFAETSSDPDFMKQVAPEKRAYNLLKIGTDAELFLTEQGTNKPVPVCGLVGGTKTEPKPVSSLGDGFAVQEDNVMLEFNVPPAGTATEFVGSIEKMMKYLVSEMGSKGLALNAKSIMTFEPSQLTSDQARTFGCEPDFCVWTRSVNEINSLDPLMAVMRTAAAHVHVSYQHFGQAPDLVDQEVLIRALDMHVGAPSVLKWPDSIQRRARYGKAGAFRPKPYGLEYRVLGNEWIKSEESVRWVFERVEATCRWLTAYGKMGQTTASRALLANRTGIESAINTGNLECAREIAKESDRWLAKYA